MAWYPPKAQDEATDDENLAESFRRRHQELYGKLLEVHHELDNSGTLGCAGYVVLVLVGYSALWSGWYQRIPGLQDLNLNNVWTYAALLAALFFLQVVHVNWLERWRYDRHRARVQELAVKAGITRYQLLARLEGDAAVKRALEGINRDTWP